MADLKTSYQERLDEIETYLKFLEGVEAAVQTGAPRVGSISITTRQQRILYSAVYLQLYNLVEATITRCLDAVCAAATADGKWFPGDLSEKMRKEWVRVTARTHVPMTDEKRLKHALKLVDQLANALPASGLNVEKSGGNWDDVQIESITDRIGLRLQITPATRAGVKRKIRNDKGALSLVAALRNDLAHGSLSFAECGQDLIVEDLNDLKDKAATYLGEVVDAFEVWIASYQFLDPAKRPAEAMT